MSRTNPAIESLVAQLLVRLRPLGVYVYHRAKFGSVYLKFAEAGIGSVRVADHCGRAKYNYRFNLRLDHYGPPTVDYSAGHDQRFYGQDDVDQLVADVFAQRDRRRRYAMRAPQGCNQNAPVDGTPTKEADHGPH